MKPEKNPKIEFTVEELREAVGSYELLRFYFNPDVTSGYDIRDQSEVEKFKARTWGPLPPLKKKA